MAKPDVYDLVLSANNKLDQLISTGVKVDNSELIAAIVGVQNTCNMILANLEPDPDQIPTVTAVNPNTGSSAGGETITVTGTNFTGATGVMFGTVAASDLQVASDTSLTVTSPAQPAAKVDVTVVDAAGTSAISPNDEYTYV